MSYGSGGGGFDSNGANDVGSSASYGTGGASWLNGLAGGIGEGLLTLCGNAPGGGGSLLADFATDTFKLAGAGIGNGWLTIQFLAAATPDTPAPIPLPAAGWLLLGALGALAGLRRRRPA